MQHQFLQHKPKLPHKSFEGSGNSCSKVIKKLLEIIKKTAN